MVRDSKNDYDEQNSTTAAKGNCLNLS